MLVRRENVVNGSGLAGLPPSEMKEMATDSVPLRRLPGTRDLRLGTKDRYQETPAIEYASRHGQRHRQEKVCCVNSQMDTGYGCVSLSSDVAVATEHH